MCDIRRLPHWRVCVDLFLEEEDDMILIMNIITFICRIDCDSWIPNSRESGYDLEWAMVFEPGYSIVMVLLSPVGYPLEYSIKMLLGLALGIYFGT